MSNASFLQDLAVVMLVAGLVTILFRWLKQPVVLGYIIAGVIIGPNVLPSPLIRSEESIHTLSELGIIFLLFTLGLEFNFRKIRQIGATALIVAPLETGLMFFAGYQIGQAFGWRTMDCVYLGGILMISSTTIITKTLAETGKHREKFAEVIFGVLIAEDIIAILLVASLSAVAQTGGFDWGALLQLAGRLAVFLVVIVILGLLVVPRVLSFVGKFKVDETLLVTVLGLCFGLSLLAVKLGFSVALGAFVMGAIMAEADDFQRIQRITLPLRDMFSAVFFVAIGLLIDPGLLRQYAWPVAVISVVLVAGKIVACSFGSFVAGYDRGTALRVGLGLAQIGEFSFIIAALGATLGLTSSFLYPIAVTVSAITSVLTPYLIRHADWVVALHDRLAPQSMLNYQRDYLEWFQRIWHRKQTSAARKLIRKVLLQLAINLALIVGVFLGAVFVDRLQFRWSEGPSQWLGGRKTFLWLAAVLLSLPIMIAFIRKLQAFSMMLAEVTIREGRNAKQKTAFRALLSNTILFTGIVMVSLLLLLLSSPLLPPMKILFLLLGLAAALAVMLKTCFVRIYARAQAAIRETLERERLPLEPEIHKPMPPLLEHAELLTLHLQPNWPCVGKTITDLKLRTLTGASVVVVRRGKESIVNPNPDVRFEDQDQLLLLGDAMQLNAAEKLMKGMQERSS
jgi:CPA2 family monovalent cation:H+ antiporter-2